MTKEEIEFMNADLEKTQVSPAWMWFGLTEKLMLSNPLNRNGVEQLSFVECSELLLLWDRREEEMKKQHKEMEALNKNKIKNF